MKRRILLSTVIAVCLLISVGAYTHFASTSASKSSTSGKENADEKTLVSVNVYSTSNPEQTITLRSQMSGPLISQFGTLLAGQSPVKDADGSTYQVNVFYSDGTHSLYGVYTNQSELSTLCSRILNSSIAKQM